MPTNMNPHKVRVALAVFDDVDDLLSTVERLRAIGIGTSDLWIGAAAGAHEHVRARAGTELPVYRLEDDRPDAPVPLLVRGYDSAIHRWTANHLKSLPQAGLGNGGAVLAVRINRSIRQLTVSGVLLSSSARVVQLHDMAPDGCQADHR